MLRLIAQNQWRDQREADDRTECNLDRVLPRLRPHQTFGPGQIGARENEGDKGNEGQEYPTVREAMHPCRRAHCQLGQHHAGAEPRQVARQPVVVVDGVRRRNRNECPRQGQHRHSEQKR